MGNFIAELREKFKMTRTELSARLNIPIRTIEGWEYGNRNTPEWVRSLITDKIESFAFTNIRFKYPDEQALVKDKNNNVEYEIISGFEINAFITANFITKKDYAICIEAAGTVLVMENSSYRLERKIDNLQIELNDSVPAWKEQNYDKYYNRLKSYQNGIDKTK